MKKLFLFVLALFIFTMAEVFPVSADSEVWADKNFDFTKVKTVYTPIVQFSDQIPPASQRNIIDFTAENFAIKNATVYSADDIYKSMLANGYSPTQDIKQDPNFQQLFADEVTKKCDLTIAIQVLVYGFDSEYQEAISIPYQTTSTSTISFGGTVGTVTTPTTENIRIPGGNARVTCAAVNIAAFDSATGEVVYQKQDYRRKTNGLLVINSYPKDLYRRILKDVEKDLLKLISGKKI